MTSVRFDAAIEHELEKLCALTKRSKSFYIKEALERYLDDARDHMIALERAKKPAKTLSTKEVLAKLAVKKAKARH